MTYPGGGGQGGWNEQQGWNDHPSGNYPTANYGGDFPQTGGFPQQQQGYGGLGVYGGFHEEPPKSKKTLWLVISAVVLVLLIGGGVTALVVNRGSKTTAGPGESTAPTSAQATGRKCPSANDKTCVQTDLGFNYEVPKAWIEVTDKIPIEGYPNAVLSSVTSYGDYTCEGKPFTKGTNGGALLDKSGDTKTVATNFTKAVATQYYSSGGTPTVKLSEPKTVKFQHKQKDGKEITVEGVQVDATVTTTGNKCLATKGMVKVLVMNGSTKLHALVINGDLEGGAGDKAMPKESELQAMIDSLQPTS